MFKNAVQGFSLIEVLVALLLSSLMMLTLFYAVASIEKMDRQQIMLMDFERKIRFLTIFFRENIQRSGDSSCEDNAKKNSMLSPAGVYTEMQAKTQYGIGIKPGTMLVRLENCVSINHHRHYLPVFYFVARTTRQSIRDVPIDALFMKIDHHPREELLEGVVDFQAKTIGRAENMTAMQLSYLLAGLQASCAYPIDIFFNNRYRHFNNHTCYQAGEVYAARRLALT